MQTVQVLAVDERNVEIDILELVVRIVDELGIVGGVVDEVCYGGFGPSSIRIDEAGDVAIHAVELVVLEEVVLSVEVFSHDGGAESDDVLVDWDDGIVEEDSVGLVNEEKGSFVYLILEGHGRIEDDLVNLAIVEKLLE